MTSPLTHAVTAPPTARRASHDGNNTFVGHVVVTPLISTHFPSYDEVPCVRTPYITLSWVHTVHLLTYLLHAEMLHVVMNSIMQLSLWWLIYCYLTGVIIRLRINIMMMLIIIIIIIITGCFPPLKYVWNGRTSSSIKPPAKDQIWQSMTHDTRT